MGLCGSQLPRRKKQADCMVVKIQPQLTKSRKSKTEAGKVSTRDAGEKKVCKDGSNGLRSKAVDKKARQRTKTIC